MNINTFNHDKFNTWEKCRRRYYFKYVKELKLPESDDKFLLGKSVHALIDYYLRKLPVDHFLKNADSDTVKHFVSLKYHPILENDVVATEWGFNCRIGDTKYWLNGRIDAIFYDKSSNKYIIVDWKTGQNIPKNPEDSFQSRIYMYAFYNAHKDLKLSLNQEDIIFQYIKTPDLDDPAPIYYSREKEKEYEEILISTIDSIEKETIYAKADPCSLKQYCQYYKLCFQ